jgi:hypothetical protein
VRVWMSNFVEPVSEDHWFVSHCRKHGPNLSKNRESLALLPSQHLRFLLLSSSPRRSSCVRPAPCSAEPLDARFGMSLVSNTPSRAGTLSPPSTATNGTNITRADFQRWAHEGEWPAVNLCGACQRSSAWAGRRPRPGAPLSSSVHPPLTPRSPLLCLCPARSQPCAG